MRQSGLALCFLIFVEGAHLFEHGTVARSGRLLELGKEVGASLLKEKGRHARTEKMCRVWGIVCAEWERKAMGRRGGGRKDVNLGVKTGIYLFIIVGSIYHRSHLFSEMPPHPGKSIMRGKGAKEQRNKGTDRNRNLGKRKLKTRNRNPTTSLKNETKKNSKSC